MKLKPFSNQIDQSKKDEILDSALKVFAEVGFKEATVRQICKKAKANVCLVSYYFDGKEGLYKAVFERVYLLKISTFDVQLQNLSDIQTPEEYRTRLKVYIEQLHERILSNPDFFKVIQRELVEGLPRLEELVRSFFSMTQMLLIEYFEYGHKRKFLKKDIDPNLAGAALMNLLTGFIQQQSLGKPEIFFPRTPKKEINEKISKIIPLIFFDGVLQ
jgi:TetR/AcrR family transcriptional regulator